MQNCYAFVSSLRSTRVTGEGGIRTLGSLLSYGALAKRCFQPLSHLTRICSHQTLRMGDYRRESRISRRIADCQLSIGN